MWLSICQDIEISYSTIHRIVRSELGGKLKVPRPIHEKQQPGVIEAFKEYLPKRIKGLINEIRGKKGSNCNILYWFQDETRLGCRTESGKKITRTGIKPKQIFQWHYNYYYIYGLFFTSLEDVKYQVAEILKSLSEDIIHSLTGWEYFLDALSL